MSASLHYSDYTDQAGFTVPYELEGKPTAKYCYLSDCEMMARHYEMLRQSDVDTNTSGYIMPQGLRNVLIISATPYQWKHMIAQRTCRRSATEIRYVMLKIWEELYKLSPAMFADAGPFCTKGPCKEGKMACGYPMKLQALPDEILKEDFPLYFKEEEESNAYKVD